MDKIKWYTTNEYVDVETGEIITKSKAEREYIITRKTKEYKNNGKYNEIKISNECRRDNQLTIF